MLNIKGKVDNLDGLKKIIDGVEKQNKMQSNINELYAKIQKKCLDIVKSVARQRLSASGTTNQDYYDDYIQNIRIKDSNDKGFTIVSDLVVHKPETRHSKAYDFSVSLAFEYGTGIIGMGSTDAPPWYIYNINASKNFVKLAENEYEEGWWIPISKAGSSVTFGTSKSGNAVVTKGYEAVEVFRYSAYEINTHLKDWIKEFYEGKGDNE